jgi:saccharopine dehydrogenase-like NADP-dependent oxidoreductase
VVIGAGSVSQAIAHEVSAGKHVLLADRHVEVFHRAFMKGDGIVDGTDFVCLPGRVRARIYTELTEISDHGSKPPQWSSM